MQLSSGTEIIKVKPGIIIKLNGKEGRLTGFDVQKKFAGFSAIGSDHVKYFNLEEIKKIQLLKDGWVLRSSMNRVKIGFKKGLDISRNFIFFCLFCL